MREKRLNALWRPIIWSGFLRVQVAPHYPIPNGTVVWFKFSQGRYLVQAALKQGRVHKRKQQWRSRARFGAPVWSEPGEA